jgi:hypothetical protein
VRAIPSYVFRSISTMLRIIVVYRPFRLFFTLAAILTAVGAAFCARFLYYWATEGGAGHVQSVVLGATLVVLGFQTGLLAFVADLLSVNRRMLEELLEDKRARRSLGNGVPHLADEPVRTVAAHSDALGGKVPVGPAAARAKQPVAEQ